MVKVIKDNKGFTDNQVQSWYTGQMCLTQESGEAGGVFVCIRSCLATACQFLFDFGVLHHFLRVFCCLSDHNHESLFVSGFQLGQ